MNECNHKWIYKDKEYRNMYYVSTKQTQIINVYHFECSECGKKEAVSIFTDIDIIRLMTAESRIKDKSFFRKNKHSLFIAGNCNKCSSYVLGLYDVMNRTKGHIYFCSHCGEHSKIEITIDDNGRKLIKSDSCFFKEPEIEIEITMKKNIDIKKHKSNIETKDSTYGNNTKAD